MAGRWVVCKRATEKWNRHGKDQHDRMHLDVLHSDHVGDCDGGRYGSNLQIHSKRKKMKKKQTKQGKKELETYLSLTRPKDARSAFSEFIERTDLHVGA